MLLKTPVSRESDIWKRLEKYAPKRAVLHRVEVKMPAGFPDVHWSMGSDFKHQSGVIELKYNERSVRPEQAIILRNMSNAGGSAFVLGRYKGVMYLVPGRAIKLDASIDFDQASFTFDEYDVEGWQMVIGVCSVG